MQTEQTEQTELTTLQQIAIEYDALLSLPPEQRDTADIERTRAQLQAEFERVRRAKPKEASNEADHR